MSDLFTNNKNRYFLLLFLWASFLLNPVHGYAQKTKKELENKKKQLQKEIEYRKRVAKEHQKNMFTIVKIKKNIVVIKVTRA